ncbi:MAG TPA: hypothetical protein VF885_22125 [Arthrobacter sp.]
MIHAAAVPMGAVNLAGSWTKFWNAITAGYPGITTMMSIIGVALVVFALVKWAWDRRRGGSMGQGAQPLWGALIPGAVLAAPTVILPILLQLLDWLANIVLSMVQTATGT